MSTYMKKVVGNLEQTRTGLTTSERTTARQNIDLNASLFKSTDNSLKFEDVDNDTKQINVTSDAYSITSNTGINIVPNDTAKTIAINHVTTDAKEAAIVRVGNDIYGHVVLGAAITAADFKAVTYTDDKKSTHHDKYIYLSNGVATEGRTVLALANNSGLVLDTTYSKYISVNCGTNLSIGTDGRLNNTYSYTLPAATSGALGGIKIGYSASGKNYAVALDSNNKAYVNVPWTDTKPNDGTLTIPVATTSMSDGSVWSYTTANNTFTADQLADTTLSKALAEYDHCHGALKYDGTLSYAPYCSSMGSAYITSSSGRQTNYKVSLVVTTGSYISKSDITFDADQSAKVLSQAGTWVNRLDAATSNTLGGIYTGYSTSGKNYAVALDGNNKAYVNVPWTDTDTHYTTHLYLTALNGTSDQVIAAKTVNDIYLALYDNSTLREQHKIFGDNEIVKVSTETGIAGAGVSLKIDGSHGHGLLAQNGTLGQQSGFPGGTISSYMAANTSSIIEIPLAMTYKTTDSTWSSDYELTRGGIALSANGTRFLKEDGSWDTLSQYSTHLYFGAQNATANSAKTNGNVYMTLTDDSTVRHSYKITGAGGTSVTSDASGNLTITSADEISVTRDGDLLQPAKITNMEFYTFVAPDVSSTSLGITYNSGTTTKTEYFPLVTSDMSNGLLANTTAFGRLQPIVVKNGLKLFDGDDEETGDPNAYLKLNPDNATITVNNHDKVAFAVGNAPFGSNNDHDIYFKICRLKKTYALTGGSANMNASFFVTYAGTQNTNPSLVNLGVRVQGGSGSDASKYGITGCNFTEFRSNQTNQYVKLVAQAYVTSDKHLIVDIYARSTESWHGVKITQLHAGASYNLVESTNGGDYEIVYYGVEAHNESEEIIGKLPNPEDLLANQSEFLQVKECTQTNLNYDAEYAKFSTWGVSDTSKYLHVYLDSSIWNTIGGSSVSSAALAKIHKMNTKYLDIDDDSNSLGALVLRGVDYNGDNTVKTILYSQTNYIASNPNTYYSLKVPQANGTLATTDDIRALSEEMDYNFKRRSAVVGEMTATVSYLADYVYWDAISITGGNRIPDLKIYLETPIIRPTDEGSYISYTHVKTIPHESYWCTSNATITSFGYSHGYLIRTSHQANLDYTKTVIEDGSSITRTKISDSLTPPLTPTTNTGACDAAASYSELIIKLSNDEDGDMAVRLVFQMSCTNRKSSGHGTGKETYTLRLAYMYEILY